MYAARLFSICRPRQDFGHLRRHVVVARQCYNTETELVYGKDSPLMRDMAMEMDLDLDMPDSDQSPATDSR